MKNISALSLEFFHHVVDSTITNNANASQQHNALTNLFAQQHIYSSITRRSLLISVLLLSNNPG